LSFEKGGSMKRKLLMVFVIAVSSLYSSQRIVLIEEFTATWCPYCPSAALGLEQLYELAEDSVTIIAYHPYSNDYFQNQPSIERAGYYAVEGVPDVYFDGILEVLGGVPFGSMYPYYRERFDMRKNIPSPLEMSIGGSYDPSSREGQVEVSILNLSDSLIKGTFHFAITLLDTPFQWVGGMTHLHFTLLDMLPNASGESFELSGGNETTLTRTFSIDESYNDQEIMLIAFVQNDSTKEVYQSTKKKLTELSGVEEGLPALSMGHTGISLSGGFLNILPKSRVEEILFSFYDASGRKLIERTLNPRVLNRIKVDSYPSGVYFVVIRYERDIIKEKILLLR